MNVSLQNNDAVSALLTVKIEKADYQEQVDKSLKNLRHKAQIPGFRKGMVPMNLIKKMYAKSVIAEEVNKLLSEKVYGYIEENNIDILGKPLPNEDKQPLVDFDTMEDFEFLFDIALAPKFNVSLTDKDEIDYYEIEISDEMIDGQIKTYTQRSGNYEQADSYEDGDMLKGLLAELDENGNTKEGGILVENAVLMPSHIKNDEQKAIFEGAKVDDVLTFNPYKACDGHEVELASMLHLEKGTVADIKSDFSYRIQEITRFVDGELNREIFDQVFGEGVVKTEEEFRARIKEGIATRFVANSDYKFLLDVRKKLIDKIGKPEYPDALLKRVMILDNADKGEEYIEENYDKSIEELTWQLVKEELSKSFNIEIGREDIVEMAKTATRAQFAQYGITTLPDDIVENYAQEMLKKKEDANGLIRRAIELKLSKALKEKVKLNNKTVTIEEFNELFE